MKVLRSGSTPDRTVSLLQVWERAFTRPTSWRFALHAGMSAVAVELDADRAAADSCVLAQLPDSVEGPLVWHRELVRGRVISTMVGHWYRCGGARVPELTFEMFLGEVCTLFHSRLDGEQCWSDLPDEVVALWGREPGAPPA